MIFSRIPAHELKALFDVVKPHKVEDDLQSKIFFIIRSGCLYALATNGHSMPIYRHPQASSQENTDKAPTPDGTFFLPRNKAEALVQAKADAYIRIGDDHSAGPRLESMNGLLTVALSETSWHTPEQFLDRFAAECAEGLQPSPAANIVTSSSYKAAIPAHMKKEVFDVLQAKSRDDGPQYLVCSDCPNFLGVVMPFKAKEGTWDKSRSTMAAFLGVTI